jgi:hypothetical protein
MRGDRHVPDASPIVSEQDQDEHEAERHGRHHEEIGCDDLAGVIGQERAPRLRGRRTPTAHIFRHRRLTQVDAELQQFALDPWRAPAGVGLRHRANQGAEVGGHRRSPAAPDLPGPPEPEARRCQAITSPASRSPAPFASRSTGARAGLKASVHLRERDSPRSGALEGARNLNWRNKNSLFSRHTRFLHIRTPCRARACAHPCAWAHEAPGSSPCHFTIVG